MQPLTIFVTLLKTRSPLLLLLILIALFSCSLSVSSPCRTSCGSIPINYPFGVDDGCGSPVFRRMFTCNVSDLFFQTPSGSNYKVQSINYALHTLLIYDPAMSTCSILQPHHDFLMTDLQSAVIPPSDSTLFAILNCSVDSPLLHHYSYLCYSTVDGGHTCDELYGACTAFRIFHPGGATASNFSSSSSLPSSPSSLPSSTSTSPPPPCCFTRYATVKFMSMNIMDCTHYTTVVMDEKNGLKGVGPLDWVYGMELSYGLPVSSVCERCKKSGGTCGFDTESEATLCLCSAAVNATVECAAGTGINGGEKSAPTTLFLLAVLAFLTLVYANPM